MAPWSDQLRKVLKECPLSPCLLAFLELPQTPVKDVGSVLEPVSQHGRHIERMVYLISKHHCQGHNWPQNMSGSGLNQPVTPSEDTLRVRQLSCRVSEEFPGRLRKIALGGGWGGKGFDLRGGQHSTLRKSYIPSFSFFLECNINRKKIKI